jgi:hypothetical protein
MKTILLAALALGAMGTVAMAAEPLSLSDAQMDKVTAGVAWAVYYSDGYLAWTDSGTGSEYKEDKFYADYYGYTIVKITGKNSK